MNKQDLEKFEKRLEHLENLKKKAELQFEIQKESILIVENAINDAKGRMNELQDIIQNIKEKTDKQIRIDTLMN